MPLERCTKYRTKSGLRVFSAMMNTRNYDGVLVMRSIGTLLDSKPDGNAIISVRPEQTVFEALELMKEHDIGCVMVMENDRLEGILSERDYARKMILLGKASSNTNVSSIMTRDVICTTRSNTVDDCLALMNKHGFRHIPVKQEEQVLGMVSVGDLVRTIIREQQETIDHLQQYIAS